MFGALNIDIGQDWFSVVLSETKTGPRGTWLQSSGTETLFYSQCSDMLLYEHHKLV